MGIVSLTCRWGACAAGLLAISSTCLWSAERASGSFAVIGGEHAAWKRVLGSMGLVESPPGRSSVLVFAGNDPAGLAASIARIENGAVAILEGDSPLSRALGIVPTTGLVRTGRIRDVHNPGLRIEWKDRIGIPRYRVPAGARVFATEWKTRTPLAIGIARGRGAAFWLALPPGEQGYERFPYLPQALAELGVDSPFVSRRLWAFFDPGVHGPVEDPDRLAAEWRRSGIAAVQVGVWDFFEASEEHDAYLRRVIEACHRNLILAYAWLELPHVSRQFWDGHPEWREKNALLKDAHVDWRRLMNLADPACEREVRRGVRDLVMRLDWDGVNLAELYFDGIQGLANLQEFTPLDDYVRRDFLRLHGFDPLGLFRGSAPPDRLRKFFDYRIELAARLESRWIDAVEEMRAAKPGLDLVLTHVDNLYDEHMRDALGADAARTVRLLDDHRMTLLIEDPATLWRSGPQRYAEISRRYAALPARMEQMGVDINVVSREPPVYPTEAQTGGELLQLIHTASLSFSRVAYYCESTIDQGDLPFLPAASAIVSDWREQDGRRVIASPYGVGVRWNGAAEVDGRPWPVQDDGLVWIPPGRHELRAAQVRPPVFVSDFNGTIDSASLSPEGIELLYHSDARALASLSRAPEEIVVDGAAAAVEVFPGSPGHHIVALPKGAHRVLLRYRPVEH
jgi:hypothetical protein